MTSFSYTHEQLVNIAQFNRQDIDIIMQCRRQHNRLGFAYQMAFVRLVNRFPAHSPFEVLDDILTFTSVQLHIPSQAIEEYTHRRQTIDEHRERIRAYLGLQRFGDDVLPNVKQFIFTQACQTDQYRALLAKTHHFLQSEHILNPSEDTLRRLIVTQREDAKQWIFKKLSESLSEIMLTHLDALLETGDTRQSEFNKLKHPPGRPSPAALLALTTKLERIEATGVLAQNISWLNNNYQRTLTHHAKRYNGYFPTNGGKVS